jgi:hypothetical protein
VLLQRATQDELDLRVQATQLVGGPALHRVVHRRIQPYQKCLALRQDSLPYLSSSSMMYAGSLR